MMCSPGGGLLPGKAMDENPIHFLHRVQPARDIT